MYERTYMTVSQVTDEVLYSGLIEMQEMDIPKGLTPTRYKTHPLKYEVVGRFFH